MNFILPALDQMSNESDVEQKLVYPLLTASEPYGLGNQASSIQTKANIRKFRIGKGDNVKLYFPDYLIVVGGFPLVAIEAKGPDEDLDEAFREARLYAAELNALYESGINPLMRIVATNGSRLVAGMWDQASPVQDLGITDLNPYSEKMAALQSFVGRGALDREFARLSALVKPKILKKPRRLLGGTAIQHEEIGHNTFGATISADFAHIFNPSSRADRSRIAKHAYIPSKRRVQYIDPIDRVIRASKPPSETASTLIDDTGAPSEIIGVTCSPYCPRS